MSSKYERELRQVLAGLSKGVNAVIKSCNELQKARMKLIEKRPFLDGWTLNVLDIGRVRVVHCSKRKRKTKRKKKKQICFIYNEAKASISTREGQPVGQVRAVCFEVESKQAFVGLEDGPTHPRIV